jgi:RNA polymerase sigma-70 factor (ECF subfamily)
LDLETGESRFSREQKHEETPERVFERQWALTLLEHVMVRLQAVWKTAGKNRQFELLKGAITGAPAGYAAAARELGMTGAAARQAVHRMRKRYRELLREEVGRTVESEEEVDDEIRALFKALGN